MLLNSTGDVQNQFPKINQPNHPPPQYTINHPPPPVYQNNPLFEGFQQSSNGFGVSNFRFNSSLPDSINRNVDNLQLQEIDQLSNPVGEYTYQRHANFLFTNHYKDYKLIDEKQVPDDYIYLDIIKNFQERNSLIDLFFSKQNVDHLQRLMINMVKFQSQGQYDISKQSVGELLTIMRSIYIQTATNPFADEIALKAQICALNKNVLDWVVPRLLVQIQAYLGYVRDQGSNPLPSARPEFMSSAGTRINRGFDGTFI